MLRLIPLIAGDSSILSANPPLEVRRPISQEPWQPWSPLGDATVAEPKVAGGGASRGATIVGDKGNSSGDGGCGDVASATSVSSATTKKRKLEMSLAVKVISDNNGALPSAFKSVRLDLGKHLTADSKNNHDHHHSQQSVSALSDASLPSSASQEPHSAPAGTIAHPYPLDATRRATLDSLAQVASSASPTQLPQLPPLYPGMGGFWIWAPSPHNPTLPSTMMPAPIGFPTSSSSLLGQPVPIIGSLPPMPPTAASFAPMFMSCMAHPSSSSSLVHHAPPTPPTIVASATTAPSSSSSSSTPTIGAGNRRSAATREKETKGSGRTMVSDKLAPHRASNPAKRGVSGETKIHEELKITALEIVLGTNRRTAGRRARPQQPGEAHRGLYFVHDQFQAHYFLISAFYALWVSSPFFFRLYFFTGLFCSILD